MYRTENFKADTFEPKRFTSEGVITLRGVEIPYHTVSEDNVFYDDQGKPIASIFSYSYFRSDVEDPSNRPVIFGYNGGPGSASIFVHAGFFGARRIEYGKEVDRPSTLPPYKVIDNPDCLLDVADLVMVDPVGTGYGLLLDESKADEFYGIEEDAEAQEVFSRIAEIQGMSSKEAEMLELFRGTSETMQKSITEILRVTQTGGKNVKE